MLTLFTVPKPFDGHNGIIQRNAIGSWRRLEPACDIILCGDEPGTAHVAREHGARFVPDIRRNALGTPLLDSIFDESCRLATTRLVCYSNADIILLAPFLRALEQIPFETFLMIGQRTTLDQKELIDFDKAGWQETLTRRAKVEGQPDPPTAIDYMVFPRDSVLRKLPAFAVGRPGWDNWFVEHARKLGIPVIDATRLVRVLHQRHDYRHVPHARGAGWEGPEAVHNRRLVGWPARGRTGAYTVRDASHVLTASGLKPNVNWRRYFPLRTWATYPLRLARRWSRKLRIAGRMSKRPLRLLAFCRYSVRLKLRLWRQSV
jgi:hypothetical protein